MMMMYEYMDLYSDDVMMMCEYMDLYSDDVMMMEYRI